MMCGIGLLPSAAAYDRARPGHNALSRDPVFMFLQFTSGT